MTATTDLLIDLSVHGHWGADPRCHPFCAHPIPPQAPASRLGDDTDRFTELGRQFVAGPLEPTLAAEYRRLHRIAYPDAAYLWPTERSIA